MMRRELSGIGASRGLAMGRARRHVVATPEVKKRHITPDEIPSELQRLHHAIAQVRQEMQRLRTRLHDTVSREMGELFELPALLLDDPQLLQALDADIRDGLYSADYALHRQRNRIARVFLEMDDAYFGSRIDDIDQVIERILGALGQTDMSVHGASGEILIANRIAPAEIILLQSQGVLAIVTTGGNTHSHSAILARSLQLPLVVAAPLALHSLDDGDWVMVDGSLGQVIRFPDAADLEQHRQRLVSHRQQSLDLNRLRHAPTRSRDGHDIQLWANAESAEDIRHAHTLGATGIGLYRTEFLFLGRQELPDEETQFQAYRALASELDGRCGTLRTLDLGADKAASTGLALHREENPALGLRGIRLALARPDIFRPQLRAILRASAYGRLRILLPMVSNGEEIHATRQLLTELGQELRDEGHPIASEIPLGAMIEVPAAALTLPDFIQTLDFLSIGTNDLAQYLLAADRNNEHLTDLYTPLHPALLRLLADIIQIGKRQQCPVAICGEIAADPRYTRLLLALGLEEFSLHPGNLLEVRQIICDSDLGELRSQAPTLLHAPDRTAIEAWLTEFATP